MRTMTYVLFAAVLAVLLQAIPASAHRAMIFAYTEGNEVITESSFSSGRPCMNCKVEVKDAATGALLLQGQTDKKGIFRFPLPEAAQKATKGLQIILNAGEGHRGEWLLEAEEYLNNTSAAPQPAAPEAAFAPTPGSQPDKPLTVPADAASSTTDKAALEKIVASAVDKKIAPLKKILLESQEKIRMSDIIGGIGYLVGFAGMLAYLRSKRDDK